MATSPTPYPTPLTAEHKAQLEALVQSAKETRAFFDDCQQCGLDMSVAKQKNDAQQKQAEDILERMFYSKGL